MMIQADVCIVGAGPGGVATALKLSYLGIPSVLVDKAVFPRDKICGDALSGKVTTLMNRLDPSMLERFQAKAIQVDVWGMEFVAPNQQPFRVPFRPNYVKDKAMAPGYVSRRLDFDQFLIEEVQRRKDIQLFQGIAITEYTHQEDGFLVSNKDGSFQVAAKILIVANGAYSSFSRKYAGLTKDPRHYAGAVRAYFKGVEGLSEDNFIELHFLKTVIPGYFWIFPLPNGYANVGLGMRTDVINGRKINLRKDLEKIIQTHPALAQRFRNAELTSDIKGYGLPLGSKKRSISGDHYMLVGDAACLVDPLTGEGIGNAFYSGFIAAEQAQKCLAENNFSAAYLTAYDKRIDRVLGSEMRLSHKVQRMLGYPWLVNIMANIISNNHQILDFFSRMYTDFSVREQLVKPLFWLKMWRKKFSSKKPSPHKSQS